MNSFGISTPLLIGGAALALMLAIGGAYTLGHHNGVTTGELSCQLGQMTAQKKIDDKTYKAYERIDHETPYAGSRDTRFVWLLDNARSGK